VIQIKAADEPFKQIESMWNPITSAPSGRSLELAVIDNDGVHALVFPCEKGAMGWKNVVTGAPVDIHPTHWRAWGTEEYQRDSLREPT
jgi:hypothetical protein